MEMEKLLTQEEINALVLAAKNGNDEAGNRLYKQFKSFLYHQTRKHIGFYDEEDLIQLAGLGLTKAIRDFDPDKGFRFITYLGYKIKGEVFNNTRDNSEETNGVAYPRSVMDLYLRMLTESLVAGMHLDEYVKNSDLNREQKFAVLSYNSNPISLNKEISSDDGKETFMGRFGIEEKGYSEVEFNESLKAVQNEFDSREKIIFQKRYIERMNQKELGKILNVSQTHICRLEKKMVKKVKEVLEYA